MQQNSDLGSKPLANPEREPRSAERWPDDDTGGCDQPQQDCEREASGWTGEQSDILEHSDLRRLERNGRWASIDGSQGSGRDEHVGHAAAQSSSGVGHSICPRLEVGRSQPGDAGQEFAPVERASFTLPVFAPGPEAIAWNDLLVRNPWLRPAIAQAEVESHLCGMADGLADMVVRGRTDALRAAGNGVVAITGAAAFIVLARRVGLKL